VQAKVEFAKTVSPGDFDIAYGYNSLPTGQEIGGGTNDTLSFAADESFSIGGASNDIAKPLMIKAGKNQTAFDKCDGPNSNLYVIVTRVNETKVEPPTTLETQERLLQTAADITITFSSWAGEQKDSAMSLFKTGLAVIVAALAVFAF
jgi:hypothetical protein